VFASIGQAPAGGPDSLVTPGSAEIFVKLEYFKTDRLPPKDRIALAFIGAAATRSPLSRP
jgi:cysteine synthase